MHEGAVRDLALARKKVQELQAKEQELAAQIEAEHPDVVQIREELALAKKEAKAREERLRAAVENRYAVFDEEPDHPALGLRAYAEPHYPEGIAIELAVDHKLYGLLRLDAGLFEQVAPTLWPHLCDWDRKTVKATIKGNLSKWAVEVEEEPAE